MFDEKIGTFKNGNFLFRIKMDFQQNHKWLKTEHPKKITIFIISS